MSEKMCKGIDNQRFHIHKCEKCGNIVEMLHPGFGELYCCKMPMVLQIENSIDASVEKHQPKVVRLSNGYEVTVGSTEHPMTEDHYIEWIELIIDGCSIIKYLKPGDKPFASFTSCDGTNVVVRSYCNLHGHWKG